MDVYFHLLLQHVEVKMTRLLELLKKELLMFPHFHHLGEHTHTHTYTHCLVAQW